VLGLLEVSEGGRPVSLPRGKESALLGLLLVHANEPLGSERLIEELWPRERPANAAKTLQIYVSRLRGRLGHERIRTTPAGYVVVIEPGELDVAAFVQLAAEGRGRLESGDAASAETLLSEALGVWRGEALADFRFDEFAQPEIRRLEELRRSVVTDRAEARIALGRPEEVVVELEPLVQEHPLWERPRQQLMLALYQTRRQADALALYRSTRKLFADELGLEPSAELQSLERAILNQAPELARRPTPRTASMPGAPEDGGAFVGRRAELERLAGDLEAALAARGRLALISGEPGIGKSRLADEVTRRARSRGADVVIGRCWEAGGAPAYWPWVQLLRACIRDAEPELLRAQMGAGAVDLAQVLPELHELFPDLPVTSALDSAAARFQLFDATVRFLRDVSAHRPLVIVLDDLHAADASSLLLLQFLGRELASSRILVIAAYRDVDPIPGTALISTIAELVREPTTRRLSLTGLNEQEVGEYLELTAAELATVDVAASLFAETEGNPLFVAETVRLLTQADDRTATHETLVIPQSVRDVISRRLARLSQECNRALQLASLLGREFAPAALARLNQSTEDTLLDTLDEAASARVISEVPGSVNRLRFTHVLIRDTLYEGLTQTRRVQLHRRTLEALEALYGEAPGPHLAELAHHAVDGGDVQRAVLYARRAGDHALALLAYEEAVRLYQLGLDQLEPGGGSQRERCELLLALGHAQVRAGEAADGKNTFLRAAQIARRLALPEELARAALGYGGRFAWARAGGDQRLVPLLREALELANGLEVPLRARLVGRLAAALSDQPDDDERAALSDEAVAMARRSEDAPTLAYTLVARFSAIWSPTTVHERLAIASEVVDLAQRIGDKERAVEGHGFRFNALMELGEVDAAAADLADRGRLTNEMRQPAQRWVHLVLETARSIFFGKFDAAEATLRETFELREARGAGALDTFELQRFLLRRERGGLTEIESALESAASAYPMRPLLRFATASLLAELDRSEKARRQLALTGFGGVPLDSDWLVAAALVARTCALLGERATAATVYERLLPYAERNAHGPGDASVGAVAGYLGLLAAARGHVDAAARHFEDALERNAQMGARPWLAHTQDDYGQLLLHRGHPADRKRARELMGSALATYRELGMKPHADRLALSRDS